MSDSRELDGQVALVTGGGRGIGRSIALELSRAGMRVAVTGRTREQVEETASEIGGVAIVGDVSDGADARRMADETQSELGDIDLLVNNAGVGASPEPLWEYPVEDWWRVFEINVLGPFLLCHAVLPAMVQRGSGRIVNMGSGSSYLPGGGATSYGASKAALGRFSELLAAVARPHGVSVFLISPGLVRTAMTERYGDDAPWTPPELAPRLVRVLASGRADALAGRYLHAEHDDIEDLIARADEVREKDLNAIRLRR
ncbi:MAG: SDR family oxidoreductase [Actinomycetota bacterium]|nr:SDR family oxidoreductase [Actinomycetota bacterium]